MGALPQNEAPDFYSHLSAMETTSALGFCFLILTATRTSEVTGAQWTEIDLKNRLWTIPAERMKMERQHQVTLSSEAVRVLNRAKECNDSLYVFPSYTGQGLSSGAFLSIMRKRFPHLLGIATPHGFRSVFRDFAEEQNRFGQRAIELCLAHVNKNKVESSYLRTQMIEQRRVIMQEWADFLVEGKGKGNG